MVESLIPGLPDDITAMCLSRIPASGFRIISQVCRRWRRFLRSEHYAAVRKLTGSVEELMCVLVDYKDWEVFDDSGNKLGRIPHVPGPFKGGFGLAVLDGKILFIGGRCNNTASADVYEFNPATNMWRKLADMNIPRYLFTYAVVDGILYVNRGYSSDDASIINSEIYNPKTNQWSLMDCPHSLSVRGFAFSFNSKLFVVGYEWRFIHIYDPKIETWEELDSGKTLRVYSYTVVRNKVYFFDSCKPGMGVFDPEKNSWSSVLVPPCNGLGFRFSVGQWNNKVILFSNGCEAVSGDFDKEGAATWITTPIILSGFDPTSVLINF